MRLGTIISLGASAVLGIGALVVARVWLPSADEDSKAVDMAPVVVASQPIAFGTQLNEKNLTVVDMPTDATPVGSFRTVGEVIKMDGGAPVALVAMTPREAVLPSKLSGAGARASVAAMIAPGMRAYTIEVSDFGGGGGHVLPGDRVDVLLTRDLPSNAGKAAVAELALQNVRVLGINLNADQTTTEKASPKTTTLEVTASDAARLSIAGKIGTLSLALRRTGSSEVEPVSTIRMGDTRAYAAPMPTSNVTPPPAPPRRPAAAPRTGGLVIVNGDQRSNSSGAGA